MTIKTTKQSAGDVVHDHVLEQYLLEELPRKRRIEIDAMLAAEPLLRSRLETLKQSNEAILEQFSPAENVPEIVSSIRAETLHRQMTRSKSRPAGLKRFAAAALVPVAIAMLMFIFLPIGDDVEPSIKKLMGDDITRVKGSHAQNTKNTQLMIYRQGKDGGTELLKNNTGTREGDLLQLAYVQGNARHGVILSIDGNGIVTLHHPVERNYSTKLPLAGNKKKSLPNAYELDDAPGFERFFFVYSEKAIRTDEILKKAEDLATTPDDAQNQLLSLSPSMQQVSLLLRKQGKTK
ncbi:MAG: hypothetical protein GY757_37160 [bacterium]|nr:hypothetical protein [bacterium]